jgi:pimeloyl-ACP methyl ester carboxylesterase
LATIAVPIFTYAGDQDAPFAGAQWAAAAIPVTTFVGLPGRNHN